jgi:hypothetical protein
METSNTPPVAPTVANPPLPGKLRFSSTLGAPPNPAVIQNRADALVKMLALLRAKGLVAEEVSTIVGIDPSAFALLVSNYGEDAFGELCATYSTRVSKGSEERIKTAAELAIGRCISILADPRTSSKEVIALAKDFMDRHFGKALQRTEFVGTFQVGEGNKEIESNLAAANKRLEELMGMRNKMIESREKKTVDGVFEVLPKG